jgi:hypothetical protein
MDSGVPLPKFPCEWAVYHAAPKAPLVLGGVVLTILALGLIAAWIPAQKALAVNPSCCVSPAT